jgi:hypothetical protein
MITYDATLQYVKGKVYELKGLDSAFHVRQPRSHLVAFYAPEHYNQELFVQLTSGEKMIFEQVAETTLAALEPVNADINSIYNQLKAQNQPKRSTDAELVPVDVKEVIDLFCLMQYHISTTNGLWATDRPDIFKGQASRDLLFQLLFEPKS